MRARTLTFAALFSLPASGPALVAVAAAQGGAAAPRVSNGRLAAQPAGASLDATFRRLVSAPTEPAWIGYTVPIVSRSEGRLCCSNDTWISDGIVFSNGRIASC